VRGLHVEDEVAAVLADVVIEFNGKLEPDHGGYLSGEEEAA
jgi:hypothetical protein